MLFKQTACTLVLVACITTIASAATIQVSQPAQVTENPYYER